MDYSSLSLNELFGLSFTTKEKTVKIDVYKALKNYKPLTRKEIVRRAFCLEYLKNAIDNGGIG